MDRSITICFQTTSEISNTLEKIAEDEKLSLSEIVDLFINRYLKDNNQFLGIKHDRRRFERKKVDLPAYIGDPRWRRRNFEAITIQDISIGGIRFAVPKGTKLEIQKDGGIYKIIIFRLPNCHWPINVQITPQRVFESTEEIQIGASLVNPDFNTYSSLQKYMV
jgi:hypothetical protein